MCRKKLRSVEKVVHLWPRLSKSRLLSDILPRDAVDMTEFEAASWWTQQAHLFTDNFKGLHPYQGDRTRAVLPVICSFKINRNEYIMHLLWF